VSVDDLHPQLAYAPCREDRDLGTHLSWVLRRSNYNFWIAISESRNYEISSKKVQTAGPVMQFCRDGTMVYHFWNRLIVAICSTSQNTGHVPM
jgi:hypothetical protein